MFDSAILDVAIGLAFILLLVSLLVTASSEILSGYLKWRSTHLWNGLEQLLQSAEMRDAVYAHPLIKGLSRVDIKNPDWGNGRHGPSYIPSRTFALALIDVLRRPHNEAEALENRLRAAVTNTGDPAKLAGTLKSLFADISAMNAPDAITSEVRDLEARLLPPVDPAVVNGLRAQVQSAIDRVPDADRAAAAAPLLEWLNTHATSGTTYIELRAALVKSINAIPFTGVGSPTQQLRDALMSVVDNFAPGRPEDLIAEVEAFARGAAGRWLHLASAGMQGTVDALKPLLDDAAGDIDRFRENVEMWFNDGMDRVSGWYKRHVGVVHAVMALVVAVAMNVDALQIIRTLWREPTLRQSLVANAGSFVDERSAAANDPALTPDAAAAAQASAAAATERFNAIRQEIGTLGLPIGWTCPSAAPAAPDAAIVGGPFWCTPLADLPGDAGWFKRQAYWLSIRFKDLLAMVLGWLVTAAAASLGAPFWFDLLKRIISIRASGKAPEERPLSPKEVPQPREPGERPRDARLLTALKR